MLCLTRTVEQSVILTGGIKITVLRVRGDKVQIGIEAPKDVEIHRQEIWDAIHGGESCGGQSEE